MTFIASVIAKKGVVVIADSLVTSQMPIMHYGNFLEYLNKQPKNEEGEISLNPDEIHSLFNDEPIYTKDYEEKLFELNKYTAITTTGIAYINGKNISDLVEEFRAVQLDIEDLAIDLKTKLNQFSDFISQQIREHLKKYKTIGYCVFIITYYEKHTHRTHVWKAIINETNDETLNDPSVNYLTLSQELDWVKVICDGQNKISDRILYGFGRDFYGMFDTVVRKSVEKVNPETIVPDELINELRDETYFREIFFNDIELLNLTQLSVQQAVDLASLLMRLEVDFQKYTKNIPTVGGVIKLAVIDEKGFRFISGNNIEQPKHINL